MIKNNIKYIIYEEFFAKRELGFLLCDYAGFFIYDLIETECTQLDFFYRFLQINSLHDGFQ